MKELEEDCWRSLGLEVVECPGAAATGCTWRQWSQLVVRTGLWSQVMVVRTGQWSQVMVVRTGQWSPVMVVRTGQWSQVMVVRTGRGLDTGDGRGRITGRRLLVPGILGSRVPGSAGMRCCCYRVLIGPCTWIQWSQVVVVRTGRGLDSGDRCVSFSGRQFVQFEGRYVAMFFRFRFSYWTC